MHDLDLCIPNTVRIVVALYWEQLVMAPSIQIVLMYTTVNNKRIS